MLEAQFDLTTGAKMLDNTGTKVNICQKANKNQH